MVSIALQAGVQAVADLLQACVSLQRQARLHAGRDELLGDLAVQTRVARLYLLVGGPGRLLGSRLTPEAAPLPPCTGRLHVLGGAEAGAGRDRVGQMLVWDGAEILSDFSFLKYAVTYKW